MPARAYHPYYAYKSYAYKSAARNGAGGGFVLAALPVAGLLLSLIASPAAGGQQKQAMTLEAARAVVVALNDSLLASMKEGAGGASYQRREDLLRRRLDGLFHFKRMAPLMTAAAWRDAEAGERDTFIAALQDYTVATYASRFKAFGGERLETGSAASLDLEGGAARVQSHIVKSDGDAVRLDYLLVPAGGGWRILDIFVEGKASQLARWRSEYAALLRESGLSALSARLRARTEALRAPGGEES